MEKREVAERFVTLFGNLQGNIEQRDQEFGEMRNSVKRCTRESEETREDVKRLARNVDEKFESTNESLNHILRILNMVVPAYALPVQEPVLLVEDDAVPTEPETTIPSEETVDVFEFLSLPQVEVETPTQEGDALALEEQAQVPERSSRDELIREWENTEREQDERGRELGDADSTESEEEEEESDDGFITNTESDQFDISDDSEDLAEFTTSGSDQELAAEYEAQKDLSDSDYDPTPQDASLVKSMNIMPCVVESSTQDESWDASVLQPEGVVGLGEAVHTSEYGSDDALDKYVNKVSPISDCSDNEEPQASITESLLPIEEELLGGVDIDTQASTGRPASIMAIVDTSESEEAQGDLAHHNDDNEAPALESAPLVIPLFETAMLFVDGNVPDSFVHRELDDDDYNVDRDDPVPLEEEIMPVGTEVAVALRQDDARPLYSPSREETPYSTPVCTTVGETPTEHESDTVHRTNGFIDSSSSSREEDVPVCTEVAVATLQDDETGLPPPFIALLTKRTDVTAHRFPERRTPMMDEIARKKINDSITFEFGVHFRQQGAQLWCMGGNVMIGILEREGYRHYNSAGLETAATESTIECLAYLLMLVMRTTGSRAGDHLTRLHVAARYHAPEIGNEWFQRIRRLKTNPTILDDFSMKDMFKEKALLALDNLNIKIDERKVLHRVGLDYNFDQRNVILPYDGRKQYSDTM